MAGFESSSFKKTVPSVTQRQLREFTVGAPEDIQREYGTPVNQAASYPVSAAEMEQDVRAARQEKVMSMGKIGDQAKKRIEILANIGRLTKEVTIDNISFTLRTLKAKETRDSALAIFKVETQLEAGFEARKQQLARAIFKIDGQDVAFVLGDDSLETKLAFIDELEESLVNKLFDDFTSLKDEARKNFGMNSDKDVKEVSEDLKK